MAGGELTGRSSDGRAVLLPVATLSLLAVALGLASWHLPALAAPLAAALVAAATLVAMRASRLALARGLAAGADRVFPALLHSGRQLCG